MQSTTVRWLISKESEKPRMQQIYRQGLEYSFLSGDGRQCCYFVWCKDFLQDAVQGFLHGVRKEIYRFHYDPATQPPLCLKRTRIMLANSRDSDFGGKIPQCLEFLNLIESQMKMRRTVCLRCDNPPRKYAKCGVYCFDGSPLWQVAPPMLSLYTLLMRVGFAHQHGQSYWATLRGVECGMIRPYQSKDSEQLRDAREGIRTVLRFGPRRIFYKNISRNYPENTTIDIMHHEMGIVAFSEGQTRKHVPYWSRHD